jgi:opacity protein-like surface antigen
MRVMKFALAAAAVAALSGAARAADEAPPEDLAALGLYLRADVGWSFLDWSGGSNDSAVTAGAGIGYQINDNIRTDVRVDWAGDYNVAPGADLGITTVLGNLYFDLPNSSVITPYVGAGLGWGWTNLSPGSNDSGFAWALTAGAAINLTDQFALDTAYRLRSVDISGPNTYEHQITTGIRFKF